MKNRIRFAINLLLWCTANLKVFAKRSPNDNLTIITASDDSHELSLRNLLQSIQTFEPKAKTVIYDLGINPSFAASLREEFPSFKFIKFPFENFPDYYNIKKDAGLYAWKPASLDESKPLNGFVVWMDAGNVLIGRLTFLRKVIQSFGFFSPYSVGTIQDWTHPKTLKSLGVTDELMMAKNLAANVIAFNSEDKESMKLIDSWIVNSRSRNLIAPTGSNRSNHRQDQSLLTILAHQAGCVRYGNLGEFPRRVFKILVHQDVE